MGLRLKILQMLQGVQTVLPSETTASTAAGPLTQAGMVAQLQAIMQAFTDVDDYRIELRQAIRKVATEDVAYRQTYARLKGVIVGYFGVASPQLAKFGVSMRTPKPLTTLQKLARDARSAQTREIRGTLGKRAKLALQYTGDITVKAESSAVPPASAAQPVVPGAKS